MSNNTDTSVWVVVFDEDTSQMLVIERTGLEPLFCDVEGGLTSGTGYKEQDTVAECAAKAIVQMRTGVESTHLKRIGRVFSGAHGTQCASYYFIALTSLGGRKPTDSHLRFLLLDTRGANYANWPGIIGYAVQKLHEKETDKKREPDYVLG